jgi:hypothetical protein
MHRIIASTLLVFGLLASVSTGHAQDIGKGLGAYAKEDYA